MKTIEELNGRWWYRFLKVLFILVLILTIVWVSAIVFDIYKNKKVDDHIVICNYGNKEQFASWHEKNIYISPYDLEDGIASLDDNKKEQIQEACDISEEELKGKLDSMLKGTDDSKPLFYIFKGKIEVGSRFKAVLFSIFGTLITILIFEVIRRIFYYIILGKIRPDKK